MLAVGVARLHDHRRVLDGLRAEAQPGAGVLDEAARGGDPFLRALVAVALDQLHRVLGEDLGAVLLLAELVVHREGE